MFPELAKLASIGALIPVSTAECERAFSAMNHIKTDLRQSLEDFYTGLFLMRISTEGPCIAQFNFERAADIWIVSMVCRQGCISERLTLTF